MIMNNNKLSLDDVIANHEKLKAFSENYNDKRGAFYSAEEHEQLAEWLEELKSIKSDGFTDDLLNMGFTKGYNKAIDDVVKALIPRLTDAIYPKDVEGMRNLINDVAKQLKEGGKNEQSI